MQIFEAFAAPMEAFLVVVNGCRDGGANAETTVTLDARAWVRTHLSEHAEEESADKCKGSFDWMDVKSESSASVYGCAWANVAGSVPQAVLLVDAQQKVRGTVLSVANTLTCRRRFLAARQRTRDGLAGRIRLNGISSPSWSWRPAGCTLPGRKP